MNPPAPPEQIVDEAVELDRLLERIGRLDKKLAIYKAIIQRLETDRANLMRQAEESGRMMRVAGGPARMELSSGLVVATKAKEKTVMLNPAKFREHFEKNYPNSYFKQVFDETAAKQSVQWTKAGTSETPEGHVAAVDQNGQIVPGICRKVPSENEYNVKVTVGSPWEGV